MLAAEDGRNSMDQWMASLKFASNSEHRPSLVSFFHIFGRFIMFFWVKMYKMYNVWFWWRFIVFRGQRGLGRMKTGVRADLTENIRGMSPHMLGPHIAMFVGINCQVGNIFVFTGWARVRILEWDAYFYARTFSPRSNRIEFESYCFFVFFQGWLSMDFHVKYAKWRPISIVRVKFWLRANGPLWHPWANILWKNQMGWVGKNSFFWKFGWIFDYVIVKLDTSNAASMAGGKSTCGLQMWSLWTKMRICAQVRFLVEIC